MKTVLLFYISLLSLSGISQNLNLNLEAHYEFDGDINDNTSNSYNLTSNNGQSYNSFSNTDSAFVFNGNTRLAQINSFNNQTYNSISFSLWFKTNNNTNSRQILMQGAYAGFGLFIEANTGQVAAFFSGSSTLSVWSSNSVVDGLWHNVTAINNGNTTSLYLDGVFLGNRSQTLSNSSGSSPGTKRLYFGASNLNVDAFTGELNDVRIYNRVLTQTEITTLATFPSTTSLASNKNKNISINIYPNPTKGNISIISPESLLNSNFVVRNMLGQTVTEGFLQNQRQDISISGEKGIYFIEINTKDNKKVVSKVIKY